MKAHFVFLGYTIKNPSEASFNLITKLYKSRARRITAIIVLRNNKVLTVEQKNSFLNVFFSKKLYAPF